MAAMQNIQGCENILTDANVFNIIKVVKTYLIDLKLYCKLQDKHKPLLKLPLRKFENAPAEPTIFDNKLENTKL